MIVTNSLLNNIVSIALEAGNAISEIYTLKLPLDIRVKKDNSPVTLADLTAHQIIATHLKQLTPTIPILSEEGDSFSFATRKNWQTFWLIDPLDGTREFINRSEMFTVNIALIHQGKPILGVIYVPLKNTLYYAASRIGAYKKVAEEAPTELKNRPWVMGDEIVLVTTRREILTELNDFLVQYGNVKITYRGSSLKFCLLAEGQADIYLRKKTIHEWDTAAGQCILEQAGGSVLDSNWQSLRYNTKPHLLNPPFIALGDSKHLLPLLKKMPIF
jgi:3'(2'), 5'-bisphosphate nucleotidase